MSKNDPYHGIGMDIVHGGIFERFPELIPYVGENYYSSNHKKLIFIGESNYFPAEFEPLLEKIKQYGDCTLLTPNEIQFLHDFVEVFPDENKWYKEYIRNPIPKSIQSFVGNAIDYKPFNDKVFDAAKSILKDKKDKNIEIGGSGLAEVAFYNYFLRPAVDKGKTKGFKPRPLDREVAGAALCGIIECLHPQIIVFLSKLAFREFKKYLDYKNYNYNDTEIHAINHPNAWRFTRKDDPNHPKILLKNILNKWALNRD